MPQLRVLTNVNHLAFDDLSTLSTLRNQRLTDRNIGIDYSVALQYRPLFNQNIVVNASAAVLRARKGLRALYGNALDPEQYSLLLNILLAY
jgi:hypothetical protein